MKCQHRHSAHTINFRKRFNYGDPEEGWYNVLVEILLLTATAARQRSSGQMVQARKREGLPRPRRLQAYSTQQEIQFS